MRHVLRLKGLSRLALVAGVAAIGSPHLARAGSLDAAGASSAAATTASTESVDSGATNLPDLGGAAPFGSAVRLGNVGDVFDQISAPAAAGAPAEFLNIVPSIGASEQFVTGGNRGFGNGGHEFVTSINPALLIAGQSPRATFTLNYNPSIQFYSNNSRNNGVNQSLDAAIDATLLPKTLQIEARAYATEQATSGGLSPGGASVFNNNNRTLTQSYSVTPSFNDKFDGIGTLDLAYSAQYTRQSGNAAFLPGAKLPYFQTNDVFAQTEVASFTTVPLFLRFDDTPSISATEDIGSGVLNGAHQYFAKNTVRYAVIRQVVLSASGGYEDLAYAGIPPTRIRDATWSFGVRMKFPDRGELVARYQHLYGFNAPYVRLSYPLTARTEIAFSYAEALTTQQQGIGAGVASSTVNSFGLPVGSASNLPVLLTNQALSVQSSLTRTKQLSAALSTQFTRDTVTFSVERVQETLVATAPGLFGFSQNSLSASVSETHELTRRAAALFYLDYGRTQSPALGLGTTSTYAASAAVTYRFTPSLYANAEYSVTNQNYNGFGSGGIRNIITVGFQKTF